jgi:zinc protease
MSSQPKVQSALEKAGVKIAEHRLANGMQVLLLERHLDPVVSVMLWYRVGARNETEKEAGVSHFLEHMMFKGASRFGKGMVDRVTTTLGGTNNAFTSADHTAYWFEFASDRWEAALEIEADRMQQLLLDQAEFEAEKQVVLEELSQGEDDPWRVLSQEVQAAVFPRHPYQRPVIGFTETLKALSVDEMRAYYRRFYHPGNAILVISGDFEAARALELAQRHFGQIPAGMDYAQADAFRTRPQAPRGEQRLTIRWDDEARRLCIAWPGAAVGTDEDCLLDLVSTVLSGGRLSRLYRRLVIEEQLATSISTHNDARVEGGSFWIFAECAQGKDPARLEQVLFEEIEQLAKDGPDAKELARAKRIIAAGEAHDAETVSDLAEDIGEFAIDGDWRIALTTLERIQSAKAPAVAALTRKLLGPEHRVVGWCLPKKETKPAKTDQRAGQTARRAAKAARRPSKKAQRSPRTQKARA